MATDAAGGGQGGVSAALCGGAVGGLFRLRADSGIAGNLCGDFVFGESTDAGDRNPHGAWSFGGASTGSHSPANVGARSARAVVGSGGFVDIGAGDQWTAVRSDA